MSGFSLAPFPKEFLEEVEKHFRASVIKLTNPLDLGDLFDLEIYVKIIDRTLAQKEVDGIVFLHTFNATFEGPRSRELFQKVMELSQKYDKPVAIYVSTEDQEVNYLKRNFNYPIFTQVVETVRALGINRRHYAESQRLRQPAEMPSFPVAKEQVRPLLEKARREKRDLFIHEAAEILGRYGIPMVR
jgi:acetyltransferase